MPRPDNDEDDAWIIATLRELREPELPGEQAAQYKARYYEAVRRYETDPAYRAYIENLIVAEDAARGPREGQP